MMLRCRYCKTDKAKTALNFRKEPRTKLGFDSVCRLCRNDEVTQRRRRNITAFRKKEAMYRKTKTCKEYHQKYYQENADSLRTYARQKYREDPGPFLRRSKEQKIRLGQKYKDYLKQYNTRNRKQRSAYSLHKYHTNIQYRLKSLISGSIRKRLQGRIKVSRTSEYVGCTWEFLIGYLEALFRNGMTWQNQGSVWHIDHILPCRSFDFTDEKQIKKCFHYTNLQPLLVAENLSKQDKLPDGTLARHH